MAGAATGYERVADKLRAAIIAGEFGLEQRLPVEGELAARFGVGRSTVREALRILRSEGLVVTLRGVTGGTFVVRPQPGMIRERNEAALMLLVATEQVTVEQLVAVREALELPATRAAALRCDSTQLAQLAATIPAPERVLELGLKYDSNRDFHATILEASGNPLLAATAAPIFAVLRHRLLRDAAPPGFWDDVASDHRRILAAMQRHDADEAVAEMERHLVRLCSTYVLIDTAGDAPSPDKDRGRPESRRSRPGAPRGSRNASGERADGPPEVSLVETAPPQTGD